MTRWSDMVLRAGLRGGATFHQTEQRCKSIKKGSDQRSNQTKPVTTARKDTNSTAAKVNITVSAISPHSLIAGLISAAVCAGSAETAAGVSLNIKIDIAKSLFRKTHNAGYWAAAMKDW